MTTAFHLSYPDQNESEFGAAELAFNEQLPIVRSLPQYT